MKPSSLATVLIRLGALCIVFRGLLTIAGAVGTSAYFSSMAAKAGTEDFVTTNASNAEFLVSSADGVFRVQLAIAALLISGGVVLYIFSRALGGLVGSGLETAKSSMPLELQDWKEAAEKDIANHIFRIFCVDWPTNKPLFDDVTGFPVEHVDAPDTAQVRAGVATYNAVMRNVVSKTS